MSVCILHHLYELDSTYSYLVFEWYVASRKRLFDLIEPGMCFYLVYGVSLPYVSDQNFAEDVLCSWGDKFRDGVVADEDLLVEDTFAVFIERQKAAEHRIQSNTA